MPLAIYVARKHQDGESIEQSEARLAKYYNNAASYNILPYDKYSFYQKNVANNLWLAFYRFCIHYMQIGYVST